MMIVKKRKGDEMQRGETKRKRKKKGSLFIRDKSFLIGVEIVKTTLLKEPAKEGETRTVRLDRLDRVPARDAEQNERVVLRNIMRLRLSAIVHKTTSIFLRPVLGEVQDRRDAPRVWHVCNVLVGPVVVRINVVALEVSSCREARLHRGDQTLEKLEDRMVVRKGLCRIEKVRDVVVLWLVVSLCHLPFLVRINVVECLEDAIGDDLGQEVADLDEASVLVEERADVFLLERVVKEPLVWNVKVRSTKGASLLELCRDR